MKTKVLFMAAIAAMAFTSCQKAENPELNVPEGQDTYIGMTIQLPESVTRAIDANATEAESTLTSVTVGTWIGSGAVTYTEVPASDLAYNKDGVYTVATAVKAKTGINNVIVIANTTVRPTTQQINGEAFTAAVLGAGGVANAKSFVMYSDAIKVMNDVKLLSKEEVEAMTGETTNTTEVTLRRAAAKVAVTSSLGADVTDGLGNGKLTDIKWNIANENELMTVFPKYVAGTDFTAINVNSPWARRGGITPPTPPTVSLISGSPAAIAYCLENAHGADVYRENNTTAVQVSAVFTPGAGKYVATITGTNSADAVFTPGIAPMTGGTFYVSKKALGTQAAGAFFSAPAFEQAKTIFKLVDADKVAEAFTKYTDGKCFWAVWINDGAAKPSYGVLRNHMYSMNITKINAPGFPEFPNTEDPIAADTWIKVDLNVEVWNAKSMGNIEL